MIRIIISNKNQIKSMNCDMSYIIHNITTYNLAR